VGNSIYWHARDLVSVLVDHANDEARICPVVARQFGSDAQRFCVGVRESEVERSIIIVVRAAAVSDVEVILGHFRSLDLPRQLILSSIAIKYYQYFGQYLAI
jgi:hypothetical protein